MKVEELLKLLNGSYALEKNAESQSMVRRFRIQMLDNLYLAVDRLMYAGEIEIINKVVAGLEYENISSEMLIGILTVTLPVKKRMAGRDVLYQKVEETLRARGEWEEGLLKGLE